MDEREREASVLLTTFVIYSATSDFLPLNRSALMWIAATVISAICILVAFAYGNEE
jgi:hypothetical protein